MNGIRWWGESVAPAALALLAQQGWPVVGDDGALWLVNRPDSKSWAQLILRYQGQPLYQLDCPWPLPPAVNLPADASLWAPVLAAPWRTAAAAAEVIDHALLADYLATIGRDGLRNSVLMLRQLLPEYLLALAEPWQQRDGVVLSKAAHRLKGAFATLGLVRLRQWAHVVQDHTLSPVGQEALQQLLAWCKRDLDALALALNSPSAGR